VPECRHGLDVAGVEQHHLEMLFAQVVERAPAIAGRFHHLTGDPLLEQVLARPCFKSEQS
jgi:hypothetical protein